jgi:predicted nucleic acid-binding Zn ribbon protein
MPTYVYQEIRDDGVEGHIFEVVQRMSEPALETHPESGLPVRRLMQPPEFLAKYKEGEHKKTLDNSNLERLGFTKYEKSGSGTYEKTVGSGPQTINKADYE